MARACQLASKIRYLSEPRPTERSSNGPVPVGDECGRSLEVGKRLPDHVAWDGVRATLKMPRLGLQTSSVCDRWTS